MASSPASRVLRRGPSKGVLLLVINHTGVKIAFGMTQEISSDEGIEAFHGKRRGWTVWPSSARDPSGVLGRHLRKQGLVGRARRD